MSTSVTLLVDDTKRLPVTLAGYVHAFVLDPTAPLFGPPPNGLMMARALAVCSDSGVCLVWCDDDTIAVVRLSAQTLELLTSDCWKFVARPTKHQLARDTRGGTWALFSVDGLVCGLSKKPVSLESGCYPGARLTLIGWTPLFVVFKESAKPIKMTPLLEGCIAAACSRQVGNQPMTIRMDVAPRYSYKRLGGNRSTKVLKIDDIITSTYRPTPPPHQTTLSSEATTTTSLSHTLAARSNNLFV